MATISYAPNIKPENSDGIVLVRGMNPFGEKIFAYIKIDRNKIEQLQRDMDARTQVNFALYGEVLASGNDEPNQPIRQFMKTQHGFQHEDESETEATSS